MESITEEKIRDAFNKEFQLAQDARTELHAKFAEQGIRLIEHRKKLIEMVVTVAAGLIVAPAIFGLDNINLKLYKIGLLFLIASVVFALLHLREHVDTDTAKSASDRKMLLSILNNRINKVKDFLKKEALRKSDAEDYGKYRQSELDIEEFKNRTEQNEKELSALPANAKDYPTTFIMFLFTSGAFFEILSWVSGDISRKYLILLSISAVIFFFCITSINFCGKVIGIYAKIITFLEKK